jgi:tetratricopeptide (TPR) repeat protein
MAEESSIAGSLVDEEEPEAEEGAAAPALDPAAASLALSGAEAEPVLAAEAAAYYRRQTRLVAIQTEHLHEQRELQLSHLRLRRINDRMRAGTQILLVLVGLLVVLALAVMLHDAFASSAVIVEPFEAPASLAPRGLTGRVVAAGLLDELTRLQAGNRASVAARHLANAWTEEIKVELPATGLSLGEINHLMKARFGHDLHITGDLVETEAGGLALTVRGDGVLPRTFDGGATELRRLTRLAGEYIYGQSQPGLYAATLVDSGRNAEAVAFSQGAYATASPADRPYLLTSWANALGNAGGPPEEVLRLYRAAIALKPDYWPAYNNLMGSLWAAGDEEGAWREGRAMARAAGGRPGRAPEQYYGNWDELTWNLPAWRAAAQAAADAHAGPGMPNGADTVSVDLVAMRLHDRATAELQLQTVPPGQADPGVAALVHFVRGRLAAEAHDTGRALVEMEAFGRAYADPAVSNNSPGYDCWIAPAEEEAGHPARADAVLAAAGHFSNCAYLKADLLDGRGDRTAAQAAYAAAVAMAPDLPGPWYAWGLSLARHGDAAGAVAKFAAAAQRGPHWADPLKAWGDALASQGRTAEARAQYDRALPLAPAWPELAKARAAAQ